MRTSVWTICVASVLFFAAGAAEEMLAAEETGEKKAFSSPRTVREMPGNMPYILPGSNLKFPPQIASYKKVSVTQNANPVYGIIIRYAGSAGESADIYIYSPDTGSSPVRAADLAGEYEKSKKSLSAPVGAGKNSSFPPPPAKEELKKIKEKVFSFSGAGNAPLYRCDLRCNIGEDRYDTLLILSLLKGAKEEKNAKGEILFRKYIKIRLSRPSGVTSGGEDAEKFLALLLKNLGFSPEKMK